MQPPRHDERGLVGVILTIVIVWALIAVIMLTRTLTAAQTIDTTVQNITGSVQGANGHLNTGCAPGATCSDALPVLQQTETIASQINDAAKPLTGEAAQVLQDVNSINSTASQILANATSINGTVHSINGLAGSINASVQGINASLGSVNGIAGEIKPGIAAINGRADTAINLVLGIKGDTANINNLATGIDTQAKGICNDKLEPLGLPVPGLGLLPTGPICAGH